MRKTKIICTLGPSTDKNGVLEKLVKEGMNVARFNFSHGLHDEQKGRIDSLKEIRTRLGKPVAALLDTKGPEIRIREFENEKVTLKEGQEFTLTAEEIMGNEKIVSVTYKELYKDVKPGNSILIDDCVKIVDQDLCADCRVYLADPGADYDYVLALEGSCIKFHGSPACNLDIFHACFKLLNFYFHCSDNSNTSHNMCSPLYKR